MRLEDLKYEFPQMPEEMKRKVEKEVAKQLESKKVKRPINLKRAMIIAFAATLALGTTVIAGTKLYQFYAEKVGEYGVKTVAQRKETESASEDGDIVMEGQISAEIENPGLVFSYLPEGMMAADEDLYFSRTEDGNLIGMSGKLQFFYESDPWVGGISLMPYLLDTEETFEILDTNIVEREEKDINGHKCIFLKRAAHEGLGVDFDRILYVSYPEGNLILQIYTADNVSDEELMKFVEGISLAEFPQEKQNDFCEPQRWSNYLLMLEEEDYAMAGSDFKLEATKQEMDHLHSVGSEVDLRDMTAEDEEGNSIETNALTACVKDVQIAEDLSLLDFDYVDEDLKGQTDESGKLRPVTIQYIKDGDGISTVDETLKTEEIQQSLVYVTVDYKNAGDVPLYNILFFANILKLQETEKGYRIFDRASQMQDLECDTVVSSGMTDSPEMAYFDVHGGNGNGSNYIDSLESGESKTVHMGFLVNKDELDLLYLNLDASGAGYEFTENSLKIGYVDIRQ